MALWKEIDRKSKDFGKAPTYRFKKPEELWEACRGYFEWADANPIVKTGTREKGGEPVTFETEKPRAYTLTGLYLHLGIFPSDWRRWREEREELKLVVKMVEGIIYEQKFTHSAVGIFNANIITRDLGMSERHEHTGAGGGPIQTVNRDMDPNEASRLYKELLGE